MRAIIKGKEPASLVEHRCTQGADYDNYGDKQSLRSSLATEQRGLCCNCLGRIPSKSGQMKIEHWHSQSVYPAEQLDYANLLGVCMGNEGQPRKNQHCDTSKGDQPLSRNPANSTPPIEDLIRFEGDGRVVSDDPDLKRELDDVLNLNAAFLEKWLQLWNGDTHTNQLEPYCQVIVYWLKKKLAGGRS
jgi:uncharacterized protein (TIGR02646 family)